MHRRLACGLQSMLLGAIVGVCVGIIPAAGQESASCSPIFRNSVSPATLGDSVQVSLRVSLRRSPATTRESAGAWSP